MSVNFTLIFAQAHIAGICCVTLALEMLICAQQTPLSRATQALHLLRDMHLGGVADRLL